MATPKKNTVDYFPHVIGNGKKMGYIEKKFGNDGYATWFKILETLAITNNHYIDLDQKIEVSFLASKCNISEDLLLEIIDELSNIEEIDKRMWGYKIIWCQTFIDNIQDAYKRRSNKCINMQTLCMKLYKKGRLPVDILHTSCKHDDTQTGHDVKVEGENVYKNPHIILDYTIGDNTIREGEEKTPTPTQIFSQSFGKQPIETLKKNCAGHTTWIESIAMKNSLTVDKVFEWLDAFAIHMVSVGKESETEQEFKRYCSSWISSEIRQGRTTRVENQSKDAPLPTLEEIALKVIENKYGKQTTYQSG